MEKSEDSTRRQLKSVSVAHGKNGTSDPKVGNINSGNRVTKNHHLGVQKLLNVR